ncbi:MAG: M14 family zinc carboxypeptidase [Bacteroidales bacterium]|nr:M14 family zinc carboxypeptidase [Bacteroidales bacterium]
MNKFYLSVLLFLVSVTCAFAQTDPQRLLDSPHSETYINVNLNTREDVNALSRRFSVDKVKWNAATQQFDVRVWLSNTEYEAFTELNIPFEMIEPAKATVTMATTVAEMANWNRYPTYSTYTQMMADFQTRFPNLCDIDTILAVTPAGDHSILVAHISNTLHQPANKPSFLYSSTMHGDEVVGYYYMLHLIDYILNNSETDPIVQNIINNVDLWICPNENPDGTYKTNDNTINESPTSTRANNNNIDLNRNFPGPEVENSVNIQPEIQAMMDFTASKHFVMSANFHGGAELANYPWDTWTTRTNSHADASWFDYICQNYVDTCHAVDASYMTEEGGVTEGGDWYVITGSRQDFMTYYRNCREITFEVGTNKVTNTSELPSYWQASKQSLLHYIEECLYGFRGIVTDAVTNEPLEAKIFINNHDEDNSEVYSYLPLGKYHRPIKAGTYSVTVTADCYQSQTFTINITDKNVVIKNIQMVPMVSVPNVADQHILPGSTAILSVNSNYDIYWFDAPNSSTPVFIGNSFTTPALYNNTTYWVQEVTQYNDDVFCQSEKSEVTVYVFDVPDTVFGELSLSGCHSLTFEGVDYTESGDYERVFPDAGMYQADSILTLHITIYPEYSVEIFDTIVRGETYLFGNDLIFGSTIGTQIYHTTATTIHGCDSVIQLTLTVISGVGIAANTQNTWQLFPNPTSGNVWMISSEDVQNVEVKVFDVYGKEMMKNTFADNNIKLDFNNYSQGIYFINVIENKGKRATFKIIKK